MQRPELSFYKIGLGANDKSSPKEWRRITKIVNHPNYVAKTADGRWHLENDIALVKLDKPINRTEHISEACLPPIRWDREKKRFEKIIASGWGHTWYQGTAPSILQEAEFTEATCYNNRETMLCIKGDNKRAMCQGDSGGPITYKEGSYNFVLGAACSTSQCDGNINTYTRVTKYLHWIYQTANTGDWCKNPVGFYN